MQEFLYPDHPGALDNRAILRNAFQFSTPQRAFMAEQIRNSPLEDFSFMGRAFYAVEAFAAKATALEDFLGWILVLKEWDPFVPSKGLWPLLDKTQLHQQAEERLEEWSSSIGPDDLRAAIHLPTSEELTRAGLDEHIEGLEKSVSANVDGIRRIIALRKRNNRNFVVGFNKIKHLLLAIPFEADDRVLMPRFKGMTTDENGQSIVELQEVTILCTPENIRRIASEAIVSQATLNNLLQLVLWLRFGEPHDTPDWVVESLKLPGWYTGAASGVN